MIRPQLIIGKGVEFMKDDSKIPTLEEMVAEFNLLQRLQSKKFIETSRMKLAAERGRLTLDAINFQIGQLKHWHIDENGMPQCSLFPSNAACTVEEQMEMDHYEEQMGRKHL